jgi:hypothetical protein
MRPSQPSEAALRPAPQITVVIDKRGAERLERCLDAPAGQRIPGIAVIVSNDPAAAMDQIEDGIIALLHADLIPSADWIARIAETFRRDPDLSAVAGLTVVPGSSRLTTLRRTINRMVLRIVLAHPPLTASNWAVRASDWHEISDAAKSLGGTDHGGVDLAHHLGPERRIRFNRHLRAEAHSSDRTTLREDLKALTALLVAESPLRRWRRRIARSAQYRRQRIGQARWRERSRLVRWQRLYATRNPSTFTEKVRYKMLRDHRQIIATFADKAAVRAYVADRIGSNYLPHAYSISTYPGVVTTCDLPAEFVMKPTHGSGAAVVVSYRAARSSRLPNEDASWVYRHVLPEHADKAALARLGARWLEQLYGQGPNKEWAYGQVPRQIIIEELLTGQDGTIPDDVKFFVFHGRCRYIQVDDGRFDRRTQDFHLPDWTHIPLNGGPPWADPPHPQPSRLEEMIRIAETLGADTDFVRVDLYDLPDRIVFGELTSYPAGGYSPFTPESFNAEFGSHWAVPRRYTEDPTG